MNSISLLKKELSNHGLNIDDLYIDDVREALRQADAELFSIYKPHAKQLLFHAAGILASQRMNLGANRTGKTFMAVFECAMHLTGLYPDWWNGYRFKTPINMWAASNTSKTTKDILQAEYLGEENVRDGAIPAHLISHTTRHNGVAGAVDTAYIHHVSGGMSTLGFKSYDQGRSKFQGTKRHIIHFDEEPPYNVYAEALIRTMQVSDHYGMIILTMTPLMGVTDLLQQFLDNSPAEVHTNGKFWMNMTWDDNPYLDEESKKNMLASIKPHEREARSKGIPTLGIGMVYPVPESQVFIDPFEIPDHWGRVYAIDFGWSPSPTAVLFGAYDSDNDVLYIYGEYTATELEPEQHATYLIKRGCNWMNGVFDPAGKISSQRDGENLVTLYRKAGMNLLSKADNSKEKGIMVTYNMLRNGRLKIFNTLPKVKQEFNMYARNEDGVPVKRNDHLMDCMRYLCISGIKVARPKSGTNFYGNSRGVNSWMNV